MNKKEGPHNLIVFYCDDAKCDATFNSKLGEHEFAYALAKAKGWRYYKSNGWKIHCPLCVKKFAYKVNEERINRKEYYKNKRKTNHFDTKDFGRFTTNRVHMRHK